MCYNAGFGLYQDYVLQCQIWITMRNPACIILHAGSLITCPPPSTWEMLELICRCVTVFFWKINGFRKQGASASGDEIRHVPMLLCPKYHPTHPSIYSIILTIVWIRDVIKVIDPTTNVTNDCKTVLFGIVKLINDCEI